MPSKKKLEKDLKKLARSHGATFEFRRQGGKHEIWECEGLIVPIPRHREIAEGTARAIKRSLTDHLKQLGD